MGLMQIIPTTWNEWAPRVGARDPFDPYSNVLVGATYLAFLRDHFQRRGHAEPHWMLVAYNWGPANLESLLDNNGNWGDIPAPQRQYALEILQTGPGPAFRWEEVQAELVLKTSLRR
jgi:soluble lytic murein transglycosylase-like protein